MSHSPNATLHTRRRPQTPHVCLMFDAIPLDPSTPSTTQTSSSASFHFTTPERISPTRFLNGHSVPRPRPTSRSPPPAIAEDDPLSSPHDMPFVGQLPPTPTPSLPSPTQRDFGYHDTLKMFANAEAGPSSGILHSLPPTPPSNDDEPQNDSSSLAFNEPMVPQRPRRGRRPASVYPSPADGQPFQPQRKFTDPTPLPRDYNDTSQQLDVDLDAYAAAEFEEDREPTLSFVTTSTVESTTGTPASIAGEYDYKQEGRSKKPEVEPRIRMRTGRSTAYSSAESSMASNAYSYHAYADNNIYDDAPPLPVIPNAYAPDHVGLGITAHDLVIPDRDSQAESSPSSNVPISPTSSFAHRPWKRDVMNRLRSDSASSSITTASTDSTHSATGQSASSHPYPYAAYAQDLTWETDNAENTPEAVALVDEGKGVIFDVEKLDELGGLGALNEDVVRSLTGTTHLLLSDVGSDLIHHLSFLLTTLAPSLVVLDISNNYLSFLPEELRYCTSLEELNISGNPVRVLPTYVDQLSSLRMLVVDGCALQSLPAEMSALTNLHTICARQNRLVSLPAWLCLLNRLETLRIDNNPFAQEWVSIVSPILARQDPSIPPRSTSFRRGLRSHDSVTSVASSQSSHDMPNSASTASFSQEGWMSPTSSAAQSLYQLSGLGPIAEDHPSPSAPAEPHTEPLASPHEGQPRGLRKMRSAGTLLEGKPSSPGDPAKLAPIMSAFGVSRFGPNDLDTTSPLAPPSSSRFNSFGGANSRRVTSMLNQTDSESELSPPPSARPALTTSISTKSSKWGFLRKMSMNRLKADKGSMAVSASANIQSLPPPLVHTNSDMGPARPSISMTRSAMTLPNRQHPASPIGEFGQAHLPASPSTLGGLPSSASLFGNTGGVPQKRGKRRSFLPIDGPPSINIAIPPTSPFMPTKSIFDDSRISQLPSEHSQTSIEDNSMTVSASRPLVTSPSSDLDPDARYAAGLESIKSYLKDLFDLSRPPFELYGGLEVTNGDSSYASSTAPSDNLASPASHCRGSVSEARRARRPTLDGAMRTESMTSVLGSEKGSFAESSESASGKKFKNDKSKRAKILREIYETERTYVRGLGELVSIYVKPASMPVNSSKGQENVVPSSERKVVFGGIESILSIHKDNLLPALERAVKPLLEGDDDDEGDLSTRTAHAVGEVFRTYIAYMKQYSTYINNFDNALSRMKTWSASSSNPGTPAFGGKVTSPPPPSISSAAISVGVGLSAVSLPVIDPVPHSGSHMTSAQRKRVKTFLKRCKEHPMHSQINLESYLLLPIQRVPRYKLLLEDLAMCTLPRTDGPRDTLDDALNEISSLASLMNEEKRDADSRLRLYHWQQRISSRGPSPLVQPHRKLILDGTLTLIRLVKKASSFVEVDNTILGDGEATITPSKVVVPVEHIAPEPMDRAITLVLCTDLLVLVQKRAGSDSWEGQVDLFNVLRMGTLREPASIVHGNVLRVVDNKSIYYFHGGSQIQTLSWCRAINTARRR